MNHSIKDLIRFYLNTREITMTQLVHLLNEKHNRNDSVQNLNNKLRKETIRYTEILEIADILDYKLTWSPNNVEVSEQEENNSIENLNNKLTDELIRIQKEMYDIRDYVMEHVKANNIPLPDGKEVKQ
jgi:dsDNA-binding SOS-regulon protein